MVCFGATFNAVDRTFKFKTVKSEPRLLSVPPSQQAVTWRVTGQLVDTPTPGSPTLGLDDSRTGHLAD